jgi:hypothetical protein
MIEKITLGVMYFGVLLFFGCASPAVYPTLEEDINLARKNKPEGLNNMGSRYQFGDGVPRDYKKAFEYYLKASKMGLALAKVNLGYMYDNGLGTKQDKQKAISLYKSAAYSGEPRGMINLGEMYRTGDHIEKSLIKACQWYDKARFATQLSEDREAKWISRGALDKYCHPPIQTSK